MTQKNDRFGFRFWLGWILWFAGSFVAIAAFWTFLLTKLFGDVQGEELTLTWASAVFGSWFLALIPFMRKKEQIWKRLNQDQEKAVDAWLQGMAVFIALLVVSAAAWSWVFRMRIAAAGIDGTWMKAVFGSWLLCAMPLLVFMYRKADQILKDATLRQSHAAPRFKTDFVEKAKRRLPPEAIRQLQGAKPALPRGHIVTAVLRDGTRIPDVFVMDGTEVLGVYKRERLDFNIADITAVEPVPPEKLPPYEETLWLRLDGRA